LSIILKLDILAELVNNHSTQWNKNITDDQSVITKTTKYIMFLAHLLYTWHILIY